MNKLKLGLAALIAATVLSSCGETESDVLIEAVKNSPAKPDGKTETTIVVTFRNGWENADASELTDDPYTELIVNEPLTPKTVNAVVDSEEKKAYDEAHLEWERINNLWKDYQAALAASQNAGINPPPPPTRQVNLFLPNLFPL
ncbi:MAG: hypothetical protein LBJ35_01250 [Spirochaetaceae bacterium]|jgi:ABC-type glycerol-3-phosphate transport system substrate-binding protein|nr:hypothetical protein [Spirochaetaceae bacterium]